MRVISRINANVLNTARTQTMRELEKLFTVAPNMAAKTIRLFPQNSVSFFTEGLGEIYDIKKTDNVTPLNDKKYSWKLKGHQVPKQKFVARVTGGAIAAGSTVGANGVSFIVAFGSSYFNPRDIIKLVDKSLLYVLAGPTFIKEGTFEYTVRINTNSPAETINTDYLQPGKEAGLNGNAYPEFSDKGYLNTGMAGEEYINYITKSRYDWSWSADAAATKYIIEDTVNLKGKTVKYNYITDQLMMNAMEMLHFNKEMELIDGRTTMDANGRCFLQDEKGQDVVKGDGLIAQMADSCKQTYTKMTIGLIEDILSDIALRMPKRTGNTILLTTGMQGYKEFGRIMRAEHKGSWSADSGSSYVQTKNGKIKLGAEYNSFEFQGNQLVVSVNNTFDHPANPSDYDSEGKPLESSKFLFIDASSYDGVQNIQMIAKDGRSFVTGELDGIGGQDGKTSGKVAQLVDGSAKALIATMGIVLHNPYSSYMLEKKII
jgi:hypothetical protein